MRVDYKKFPDIPPHCQLNAKPNRPGEFQVFRENRVLDPATGKKKTVRETIGIIKNDRWYKRIVRRGIKSVLLEVFLVSIGHNLYKYHNKQKKVATAA